MTLSITMLGLGPGRWADLTLEAHEALAQAARQQQPVYFRTLVHPTVDDIRRELPNLSLKSFDRFYEESENWETLYTQIAELSRLPPCCPVS